MNFVFLLMAFCFSLFPIFVEKNIPKAGVYFIAAAVAAALYAMSRYFYSHQQSAGKRLIYLLITISHANIIIFGIFLGVWANTASLAATFMSFLVVSLTLFIVPPTFVVGLNTCALAIFTVSTVMMKEPRLWTFDVVNAMIAYLMGLFFSWRINVYRLSDTLSSIHLEEERDRYYEEGRTDELTQLNNRRCFMNTLHRYVTNFRTTDKWICLAMIDVDFFKNYNDHYGHPKGDEVLRSIGRVLKYLRDSNNKLYTARLGGEEFAVLWFEDDYDNVGGIISLLQKEIEGLKIPHGKSSVAEFVTVSIGVYTLRCGEPFTAHDIYDHADKALYEAKSGGRNRAVIKTAGES